MTELRISAGRCQFCHRSEGDVPRLLRGDSAFICSDCVARCNELLELDPDAVPRAGAVLHKMLLSGGVLDARLLAGAVPATA